MKVNRKRLFQIIKEEIEAELGSGLVAGMSDNDIIERANEAVGKVLFVPGEDFVSEFESHAKRGREKFDPRHRFATGGAGMERYIVAETEDAHDYYASLVTDDGGNLYLGYDYGSNRRLDLKQLSSFEEIAAELNELGDPEYSELNFG